MVHLPRHFAHLAADLSRHLQEAQILLLQQRQEFTRKHRIRIGIVVGQSVERRLPECTVSAPAEVLRKELFSVNVTGSNYDTVTVKFKDAATGQYVSMRNENKQDVTVRDRKVERVDTTVDAPRKSRKTRRIER